MVHRPRVFISYARADLQSALEIYDVLRRGGANPWMDVRHLVPGQDWELEIRNAVEEADFFVACLSKKSVSKRGDVQKELKIALSVLDQMPERAVFIIPVRLEECPVPRSLAARQRLDWSSPDAPERLLAAVGVALPRPTDEEEQAEISAKRAPTPLSAAPHLEIYAFGRSRVVVDGKPIRRWRWGGRLPKELLFYLLEQGPQTKEEIALVFWPDYSPARIRSAFHATVYRLRRAIDPDLVVYDAGSGTYRINEKRGYSYDVEDFEKLYHQAMKQMVSDQAAAARLLEKAISLYAGDYFEDSCLDWSIARSEDLTRTYTEALLALARVKERDESYQESIDLYREALKKEPFREDIHRMLMRCHILAGQPALAIRHYFSYADFLEAELGMLPMEETTALYREIAGQPTSFAAG